MHQLNGRRKGERSLRLSAEQAAKFQHEKGANAFSAAENAVSLGFEDSAIVGIIPGQRRSQGGPRLPRHFVSLQHREIRSCFGPSEIRLRSCCRQGAD